MLVKFLCIFVTICIATSALLAAPAKETRVHKNNAEKTNLAKADAESISPFSYVAGGALSVFPGFGLGHMVQGRWLRDYGWVFTAGQTLALVGAAQYDTPSCDDAIFYRTDHEQDRACDRERERREKFQPYWIAAFALLKLGEVVHAWWPSKLAPLQQGQTINNATVIPRHRYLWGGALGTTVGFGLGHAMQGRWWRQGDGWAYTLTQLSIVPAIYAITEQNKCEERARAKEQERRHEEESWGCSNHTNEGVAGLLIATYIVSRIFEIFSVWDIDYNLHRVADKDQHKSLLVLPYASPKGFGLQLAFAH